MPAHDSPTPAPDARPALSPDTVAVVAGRPPRGPDAELNVGVSLTATYVGGGAMGPGELGYGRFGNPTWTALEEAIGRLEGGHTLTFASGMAGFAFNLIAAGILFHWLPPQQTATVLVLGSLLIQLATLGAVWKAMRWQVLPAPA